MAGGRTARARGMGQRHGPPLGQAITRQNRTVQMLGPGRSQSSDPPRVGEAENCKAFNRACGLERDRQAAQEGTQFQTARLAARQLPGPHAWESAQHEAAAAEQAPLDVRLLGWATVRRWAFTESPNCWAAAAWPGPPPRILRGAGLEDLARKAGRGYPGWKGASTGRPGLVDGRGGIVG